MPSVRFVSADVVEALEWMLPQANAPNESCIVVLDWFSGHLTKEAAAIIKQKGHVRLFHGGGTTPSTQISDTRLHAILAGRLVRLEVGSRAGR